MNIPPRVHKSISFGPNDQGHEALYTAPAWVFALL